MKIYLHLKSRVLLIMLLCLLCMKGQTQLCAGSLGDPVVNKTFGQGSSPGAPLGSAITSYTYVGSDCPLDGSYTIRNSTSNCFTTWHSITSDHTGDPQGYFMLVNASFAPSDFYVETVKNLCANTTYEFAAWVMNVLRVSNQINPNITFTIEKTDGTILGTFNTGTIPISGSPQWKQYGFNFKTPPGTFDVVLRMRNNAPGGIGNDIALDDITFRPCGASLHSAISGNTDTVSFCVGENKPFLLEASNSPFPTQPSFQWQLSTDKGATWKDIEGANQVNLPVEPTETGTYWYRITAAEKENFDFTTCRIASNIVAIYIQPKPTVYAGPDKVILKGDFTTLEGQVSGADFRLGWNPSQFIDKPNELQPKANPEQDIEYALEATSAIGCTASDTVLVKVINGLYIPTSFTPNGDGKNDSWNIHNVEFALNAEVWVFNRYGEMIYHAKGGSASWNGMYRGKPQPTGVYIYMVDLKKNTPLLKGLLTLIR